LSKCQVKSNAHPHCQSEGTLGPLGSSPHKPAINMQIEGLATAG